MDQGATDFRRHLKDLELPLAARTICEKGPDTPHKIRRVNVSQKMLSANKLDGGDCAASGLWCQEKRLQDIVVRLWKVAVG